MHVLKLNLTVNEDDIIGNGSPLELMSHVKPNWKKEQIKIKDFTDGITNRLFGCYLSDDPDDMVLIRLYGRNTDMIIDRKAEVATMRRLSAIGCGAPVYATFKNGICYGYIPGETLDVNSVRDPIISKLVAEMFVKLHTLPPEKEESTTCQLFPVLRKYIKLIPNSFPNNKNNERFLNDIPSKSKLFEELDRLEEHLTNLGSPVVFCHNDALLKNVIYDQTNNTVAFIDYEYAGYNYQAFDIANHFCEYAGIPDTDFSRYPDKKYQLNWLRTYLEFWNKTSNISENELETLYVQVNKFALASFFMWGLWGLVQAANSSIDFDFFDFAIVRLNEFFRRKDECYSLSISI